MVAGYAAVSAWMTWPLVTRPGSSLAADYGDPVFVSWVLGWVADHLTAVLQGNLDAWGAMWHAPIFSPEPGTLTYSDHFLAQAVQALPLWWLTHNPLLLYNALLLATMTLTAVAAHGLAARLSGSHVAGVVAGITCAFNEYRTFWLSSHLQILSLHWWIAGLWALEVFVASRSLPALAAATLAFIALHYSSSYLMAYCAPFTVAFAVWSLSRHGRLRDTRAWAGVAGAGLVSVAAVWPVVARYLATQKALTFSRSLEETSANSATLEAYGAALPWLAPLVLLAIVGALAPRAGAAVSGRARWGLFALASAAILLSFGPVIRIGGHALPGPYLLLRDSVPGFAGLRVPHRFVTIAATFLAVLAGFGAMWLVRWRLGLVAVILGVALVTRHAWQPPFPLDGVLNSAPLAPPPAYLRPVADMPPLYRFVATTPVDAVIAELPFGDIGYEIRYTFFTGAHRRRSANGYSGVLPPSYLARREALASPLDDLEATWAALAHVTHVVVHTAAWTDDTGARVRAALELRGARVVASVDGAWLYELPPD